VTTLFIDPGDQRSALVSWDSDAKRIVKALLLPNMALRNEIMSEAVSLDVHRIGIEMVASYGMAVGKTVFETCTWIGRWTELIAQMHVTPELVYRMDIKMHHCKSAKAKDSNIRQALIDRFGAPGTKKNPGLTYGLKEDLWAAFAGAVYLADTVPASA